LLDALTKRLESKTELNISKTQFGFRRGCGTREAIHVMRSLFERSLEHANDILICFVDLEKAFDCVDWKKAATDIERTRGRLERQKIDSKLVLKSEISG